MTERDGTRPDTPISEPAPTLTGKARSDEWVYVNGNQPNSSVRGGGLPAPTVLFGHRMNDVRWFYVGNNESARRKAAGAGNVPRGEDQPAPTLDTTARQSEWVSERPSTTVCGDARIAAAGHHDRQMVDSIRVTVEEAAVLQSFPVDYPWQGSRSKQFEQVGNAVPPLLALRVLEALIDAPPPKP